MQYFKQFEQLQELVLLKKKELFWCKVKKVRNIDVEQVGKMLKYFNNSEHPAIWSNLGGNCMISFRDSNKKQTYGTRNNKNDLMMCLFLEMIHQL